MARLKLLSVALLSVLAIGGTEITPQAPNAEVPAWVIHRCCADLDPQT